MRLDLADRLRCPRAHAPSPLVVVARQVDGRELLSGFAGCPVCHVEARIEGGVIRFPGEPSGAAGVVSDALVTDDDLTRLAALMGLDEPGGTVLLAGSYARFAPRLAADLEVTVVVTGAPPVAAGAGQPGVCVVELPEPAVPFSDHTFRAAALDAPGDPDANALITDALRTVAIGGRILGRATMPLPADVKELARDDREWVGEREQPATRVTLGRARAEQ